MLANRRRQCLIISALCVVSAHAWACEDDHPPVLTTPMAHYLLKASDGPSVLTLSFDPRGVGGVAPNGDDFGPISNNHMRRFANELRNIDIQSALANRD